MEIHSDKIVVIPATHSPDGKPLEPEERPAARILDGGVPLSFTGGAPIGAMNGQIQQETTAGEIAQGLRQTCATCKHFDNAGWVELRKKMEWGSAEERAFVNEVRAGLDFGSAHDVRTREQHLDLSVPDAPDFDIEHALNAIGLCRARTEIFSRFEQKMNLQLFHPLAGCPGDCSPTGEWLGNLYTPKDRAADTAASRAFDRIMQMARGETPEK